MEIKNGEQTKQEIIKVKVPKKTIIAIIALTIFLSSVFGAVFGFMSSQTADFILPKILNKNNHPKEKTIIGKQKIIQEESAVIDVVEKASPAVVSIVITKDVPKFKNFFESPDDLDSLFEFFNRGWSNRQRQEEPETEKQKVGGGSGFIVSADGMIITNKHVVEDTNADYTVITNDGKEYSAKVLARHPAMDVAVIKIKGDNFPVLKLGDSDNLKIGQTAIAIGNSLGEFSNSVSRGIVSGLKRDLVAGSGWGRTERLSNIIQTDAAINPGNSGGPLLNIKGEVIGVNVAMAQGAENIGFALPINEVKKTIQQVKDKGKISIPFLGVRYIILNKSIQKENDLPFDYGALVLRGEKITDLAVVPGSPADKAGIVENDIILEINGEKITEKNQLSNIIVKYSAGDEITLKVWHKGKEKEVKAKLEERK